MTIFDVDDDSTNSSDAFSDIYGVHTSTLLSFSSNSKPHSSSSASSSSSSSSSSNAEPVSKPDTGRIVTMRQEKVFENIDWTTNISSTLLMYILDATLFSVSDLAKGKGKPELWTQVSGRMSDAYSNIHKRCNITSDKCCARFTALKNQYRQYCTLTKEFENKSGVGDTPNDDWWNEAIRERPEVKHIRNMETNAIEFLHFGDIELCLGGCDNAKTTFVANQAISSSSASRASAQKQSKLSKSNYNYNSNSNSDDDDDDSVMATDDDLLSKKVVPKRISKQLDEGQPSQKYARNGSESMATAIGSLAKTLAAAVGDNGLVGGAITTATISKQIVGDKKMELIGQINQLFAAKKVFCSFCARPRSASVPQVLVY